MVGCPAPANILTTQLWPLRLRDHCGRGVEKGWDPEEQEVCREAIAMKPHQHGRQIKTWIRIEMLTWKGQSSGGLNSKELKATKECWEREKQSFPRQSTPTGYLILNGQPWENWYTNNIIYGLSRSLSLPRLSPPHSLMHMCVHNNNEKKKQPWIWERAKGDGLSTWEGWREKKEEGTDVIIL